MSKVMQVDTFPYFAYGSNMFSRRLRAAERAPSAAVLETGYVAGRRLTFDKLGRDGSGKCDAEATNDTADRVYGVLYEISLAEKPALDSAEGLGAGYRKEALTVVTASGARTALCYIATAKRPGLRPYHWYKALAVAGAIEHHLPQVYVERLGRIASVEDPDRDRRIRHETILAGG